MSEPWCRHQPYLPHIWSGGGEHSWGKQGSSFLIPDFGAKSPENSDVESQPEQCEATFCPQHLGSMASTASPKPQPSTHIQVSMCTHVCTMMLYGACMYIYVMYEEVRGGCRVSSSNWMKITVLLDYLVSELLGSACLQSPNTVVPGKCSLAQLLCGYSGLELRSSCFHSNCSYSLSHLPSPQAKSYTTRWKEAFRDAQPVLSKENRREEVSALAAL